MKGMTQAGRSPLILGFLVTAIMLYWLLTAWSFQSTFVSLHTIWTQNNETYSHGYILVAFVLYVLFTERHRLQLSPSYWASFFAFGIGAVWVAANAVQILLIQQMLVPLFLGVLLIATIGFKRTLQTWVPVAGLYLAIPIMDVFLNPLQDLTTWAVTQGVRIVGITAYIEQYDIHIPYGTLRIADGCAGLNYMLAGLSVGLFYAFLNLRRKRDIGLAICLIILLSLIGNWIRVFALVMIAYDSQMQSSLVDDHGFFGWVIFAVLMVGYFFFMERYSRKIQQPQTSEEGESKATDLCVLKASITTGIAGICLVSLPFVSQFTSINTEAESRGVIGLPATLSAFSTTDSDFSRFYGTQYKGSDELQAYHTILSNGASAKLLIATYVTQDQGKELVYYANRPARGIRESEVINLDSGRINTGLVVEGGARIFWFHRVGNEVALSDFETKLLQLKNALNPQTAQALVLYIDCPQSCEVDALRSTEVEAWLNALLGQTASL